MSLFVSIIFIMTFVPQIGFINLGFINATIVHIPVIIGSVLLGARRGACLGAMFGAASLIRNTVTPNLTSFVFSPFIEVPGTGHGSLLAIFVCFAPRILVGVIPYFIVKSVPPSGGRKYRAAAYCAAGISGSAVNTLLVMHMIYFMFSGSFAAVRGVAPEALYGLILSVITTNGIPEAIAAGILTPAICGAVERYRSA
jgi:uncharacterized membrane protein